VNMMTQKVIKEGIRAFYVRSTRAHVLTTCVYVPESLWRCVESYKIFNGENDDASRVQAEQLHVVTLSTTQRPPLTGGRIHNTARYRLHDVSQHRYRYEKPCNDNNN